MERETDTGSKDTDFTKGQPSTNDIVQSKKAALFNHVKDEQNTSCKLGFCLLLALLKILPIFLFFTVTQIKILGFTLVLLAASVDFWTLKNIIAKELVSMAWWMKVNAENGNQEWIFHSEQGYTLNKINETFFWGSLTISTVFWGVSTLLSLILSSLFWISLCAFCFFLNALNYACFVKCKGMHSGKIKDLANENGLQSARRFVDY